ncbi:LOW QUALITY PROTEIN: hypothetical protein NC651_036053 [Populus alba x Populus x berolinensis]|nr:LOW QUALITY PROTEIN: hypothetical protein NC651_036053 [Populus alba x Populus x berolinensis]
MTNRTESEEEEDGDDEDGDLMNTKMNGEEVLWIGKGKGYVDRKKNEDDDLDEEAEEDDPLAEVDLDKILTVEDSKKSGANPGVYIANDNHPVPGLLFEPLMALIPVILSMVTKRTFFQIFQAGIVLGDRLRANARQYLLARPGASVLNEPGVAVSRAHLRC